MMAKSKLNNKKDILLLLLYSKGVNKDFNEPIRGRTRLVKMLFLFCKEGLAHFKSGTDINDDNFYTFFPWYFGPFSQQIYDDVNFFQLRGFMELSNIETDNINISFSEANHYSDLTGISIEQNSDQESYMEQEIRLTDKGISFTKELYAQLSENQKLFLEQFKKKFNSTPLKAILRYVYQTYPDSSTNSIIKDNILGND
jgi:uncharacterized protein